MNNLKFPFLQFDQRTFEFENYGESFSTLKINGPDAKRFLNGQLTSDLENLKEKEFHESARLDRTGRVKSFFILGCTKDSLDSYEYIIIGNENLIDALKIDLEKYIIMDDVEIVKTDSLYTYVISYKKLDNYEFHGNLGGLPTYIVNQKSNLKPLNSEEYKALIGLRGLPSLGVNVQIDQLVTDTVLNLNSVAPKKGCYLGQETVSKIESRRGGAYFPILIEFKNDDLDLEIGSVLSINEDKLGKLLGKYSLNEKDYYLVSSVRKYRVDEMKIEVEGLEAMFHYLPLGGEFETDNYIELLYENAVNSFHNGNSKEALILLNKILAILPDHEDSLETIGVIYGQLGEFEKGIQLMDEVLKSNPDSIMAHTNKSLFYMKLGKIEEAEEEKAQATVKSFTHFGKEAQEKRIVEEKLEAEKKEIERREQMFLQVLEIDEADTLANYGMGDVCFKRKEWDKANSYLKKVLLADPQYSVAFLLLGKTLIQSNKKEEAKEVLSQGVMVASNQGDLMPANEMQQLLNKLSF